MNNKGLLSKLKIIHQKLIRFRKAHHDKSKQRKLADQTINDQLSKIIKPVYLANAFVNNNIQSKDDAIRSLKQKIYQLNRDNHNSPNKKITHDLKKGKANLIQVQNFSNRWINFTGNGKHKELNLKTLINAVQELEEYL